MGCTTYISSDIKQDEILISSTNSTHVYSFLFISKPFDNKIRFNSNNSQNVFQIYSKINYNLMILLNFNDYSIIFFFHLWKVNRNNSFGCFKFFFVK